MQPPPPSSDPVLSWQDGVPVSPRFADVYRSKGVDGLGGLAQARFVFMQGCHLPQGWQQQAHFCILELGFGLGLNFLATVQAWLQSSNADAILHYVGVEAYPVTAQDIVRSAQAYEDTELTTLATALASQWWGLTPGWHRISLCRGRVELTLIIGHVQTILPQLHIQAQAVYLDGFSPARNPEMWSQESLQHLPSCCAPGARLATYSVAGGVVQTLQHLGFVCEKHVGLPPKRHALRAVYANAKTTPSTAWVSPRGKAIVVGAGLAGAACARSLAQAGWSVRVLDAGADVAQGASGLPAGLLSPRLSIDDNLSSRMLRTGLRMALQQMQDHLHEGVDYDARDGVYEYAASEKLLQAYATACQALPAYMDWTAIEGPLLHHQRAAWCKPASLVKAWLAHATITVQLQKHVPSPDALEDLRSQADIVVLACSLATAELLNVQLPYLRPIRGQMLWGWEDDLGSHHPLATASNGNGYWASGIASTLSAQTAKQWACGATYQRDRCDTAVRIEDDAVVLSKLQALRPEEAALVRTAHANGKTQSWAGVRCYTPTRTPVVSQVLPGVYACTGLGSRGLSLAWLCAQTLCGIITHTPPPVPLTTLRSMLAYP